MTGPLSHLDALERALTAKGFPAMSPWWRATLDRFYATGRRQLVARVGRRGGKSSTLARVAVLEALFGDHKIPPGDIGVVAIISVSRDEASQRLRTVKAILDALGIKYRPVEGGIELEGRPVAFKVFAASIAGVSGFTCICAIADEVAKWRDADSGSNPATEVLASLRPTLATQPNARIFLSSSPLGTKDAHAAAFNEGETSFQCVAHAPTWIANPTITEADTVALEPDERRRLREYGAIPSDTDLNVFTGALIDACIVSSFAGFEALGDRPLGLFDGSQGKLDAATWGLAQWARPIADEELDHLWMAITARGLVREDLVRDDDVVLHGRATPARDENHDMIPNPRVGWRPPARLALWGLGALEGKFAEHTSFDEMVAQAAQTFKPYGARDVLGDAYMAFALLPEFKKHGQRYVEQVWDHGSKSRAVLRLRQMFRDQRIAILDEGPETAALKSELLNFKEKVLPSGVLSYGARNGAHDDRVALLINLAMADTDAAVKGSPIGAPPNRRHELAPSGRDEFPEPA